MRIIDDASLEIDYHGFTACDVNGPIAVKARLRTKCLNCQRDRETSLIGERKRVHPWWCASCAISAEWKKEEYLKSHVVALIAANTQEKRHKLSLHSKRNWANAVTREAMSANRDRSAQAIKAAATRKKKLLAGAVFRSNHGKHVRALGVCFRSTYEARFAQVMSASGKAWQYEPRYFALKSGKLYLPDFIVDGIYVEVKGWWRDDAREKFDAFITEYPELKCALVMREQLEKLESKETSLEACVITICRS